jgi:hypothetical protein
MPIDHIGRRTVAFFVVTSAANFRGVAVCCESIIPQRARRLHDRPGAALATTAASSTSSSHPTPASWHARPAATFRDHQTPGPRRAADRGPPAPAPCPRAPRRQRWHFRPRGSRRAAQVSRRNRQHAAEAPSACRAQTRARPNPEASRRHDRQPRRNPIREGCCDGVIPAASTSGSARPVPVVRHGLEGRARVLQLLARGVAIDAPQLCDLRCRQRVRCPIEDLAHRVRRRAPLN